MDSGANHPAQHLPTFVPRLAETAKSQPFEMPNSVLSHPVAREFSLTEGAARGTRGHLGPGGRDQRVFVAGIMVLELGQRPGDPGEGDGL